MADIFFTQWANFLVNLAGCTLSPSLHECWVWEWKLRYLESRKSVSCSLWSKSLLLLGLLIPHGAAVFDTHSNNTPRLFSDTRLSFICASCLSFVSHPRAVAGLTPLHSTSIFYPRTVAAPRGDVSAKRNHVCDHKTSVLWQAKSAELQGVHVFEWERWKEVESRVRLLVGLWVNVFICIMIILKFPHWLTSDSRRTINLRLFVKTIFWTWIQAHIGLWNVNVIACNSSHLLSS